MVAAENGGRTWHRAPSPLGATQAVTGHGTNYPTAIADTYPPRRARALLPELARGDKLLPVLSPRHNERVRNEK